eukprot:g3712.t1
MNMSRTGAPNLLPVFVDVREHGLDDTALDDTCPDDIWENLINASTPKLPYQLVDDYTRDGADCTAQGDMPTVVAESAKVVATFFPATGGKLASLRLKGPGGDASGGTELLFRNPVYQPAALGRLNAWTSGGVEFNWPRLGHTVFTSRPVFVAEVSTARGPLVRVYEFDREMNTTYQVDVFLPPNGTTVWAHVKVRNPGARPIPAYWWTNIGVPINRDSRVVYEADFAIVSAGGASHPLRRVPFPHFADAEGSGVTNASFGAVDHSYPRNYGVARENFIREGVGRQGAGVRKFMALHDGRGGGLAHTQSAAACQGRKFWVWGSAPDDAGRMRFLSSAGHGDYIEMQAGPAPTQSQTFPLPARGAREWTETLGPLRVAGGAAALRGEYGAAVDAVRCGLNRSGAVPEREFHEVDAWLRAQAERPVTRVLARGGAWGALHAELLLRRGGGGLGGRRERSRRTLPGVPGLDFGSLEEALDVDASARPWASLLVNGTS